MPEKLTARPSPCASCPYRCDVPSGIWAKKEYEKLRSYDGEITDQAVAGAHGLFFCHQSDGKLCAGWAGCHDMHDTFAARLHASQLDGSVWDYESPVPLFASGNEAADHGEREIESPPDAARSAIRKITKVRDLRGNPVQYREVPVMKYDTLKQLHDAVKAGKVTGTLMLDNDSTGMYADGKKIFEMHSADLLEQALDILGIAHEHV
jgi:hypothetical protein